MKKSLVLAVACLLAARVFGGDLEAGKFTLTGKNGTFSLQANDAKVNDVLGELAKAAHIDVALDPKDTSKTSASLADVNIEKLVTAISQSYGIIYVEDPATKQYRVERIAASGAGTAEASAKGKELMPGKIVEAIMQRAKSVKSYHQSMSMSMSMMGNPMTMQGEMWAQGDKIRIEMTVPPANMKQIIVSDGKTAYTYMPMIKMVQKMDVERLKKELGPDYKDKMGAPGSSSSANPLEGMDPKSFHYRGTEELNGESVYVLEGKLGGISDELRKMNPMTPQNAKFWISTKDGMPRQASFFGASGQEMMSQQFKNVTLNPQIDPALLSFTVPEGVQVVDMTDGVINMTRQMKQIKPMSPPAAPAAK